MQKKTNTNGAALRNIPSIDRLLHTPAGNELISLVGRELAIESLRLASNQLRELIVHKPEAVELSVDQWLTDKASDWLDNLLSPSLKQVMNLTGTVLHTNLGRAPMPEECIDAMIAVSRGASNLEFNLATGKRGDRDDHVESWLCRLTGAEAATVVNNNAAAVLLTLNSLASRRSVAVSRGELIEIGGSFRIPDIMKRAGCKLSEVGTTNRTHLADFEEAVASGAACVMRVHTSNFRVEGFTSMVSDKQLGELASATNTVFINDLGSGALVDMTRFGLPYESTPAEAISDGAHVVTFSGDKLLGGPQCGLIVGSKTYIDKIKKNPMKRALRCDKVTLAALEAILRLYADPEKLKLKIPSIRILSRTQDDIAKTAESVIIPLQDALTRALSASTKLRKLDATVSIEDCSSQIGSGALPIDVLPSKALVVKLISVTKNHNDKNTSQNSNSVARKISGNKLELLASAFRELPIPIIGRLQDNALWLDLRCVEDVHAMKENLQALTIA